MVHRDKESSYMPCISIFSKQGNVSGDLQRKGAMSDLEEGEFEEMEEEEGEMDSNEEEDNDDDDDDDEDEEEDCTVSLFDALAAAQEAGERYREMERGKINESCRLQDDFLITAFRTAIRSIIYIVSFS